MTRKLGKLVHKDVVSTQFWVRNSDTYKDIFSEINLYLRILW